MNTRVQTHKTSDTTSIITVNGHDVGMIKYKPDNDNLPYVAINPCGRVISLCHSYIEAMGAILMHA